MKLHIVLTVTVNAKIEILSQFWVKIPKSGPATSI